jgi:hypothetical protein
MGAKKKWNFFLTIRLSDQRQRNGRNFMRSVLLWAIGIPLPIILILWLFTGHA